MINKRPRLFLSIGRADGTGGFIYRHHDIKVNLYNTIEQPATNGYAICYVGKKIVLSDITTNLIYVYNTMASATPDSSFASPGEQPSGLTEKDGNLRSLDSIDNLISLHTGVTSTVASTFATPGSNGRGLASDGTNLKSADRETALIYLHAGETATISSSFAAPASQPSGLSLDPLTGNLISCDDTTDKCYVHDGETSTILYEFTLPDPLPQDIAI